MFKELFKFLLKKHEEHTPQVISHWLQNPGFNYGLTNEEVRELQESINDYFSASGKSSELDFPCNFFEDIPFYERNNQFDYIDLFAGIGGFHLAMSGNGGNCVFASEWEKSAQSIYMENYGLFPFGDINDFTGLEVSDEELERLIPNHNILCGGFPCQPFSLAGVSARNSIGQSHGFECKTQGTLFFSIARVARVKQPEVLLLENVKNLVTHNKGETFRVIVSTLEEELSVGYEGKQNYRVYPMVVNSDTVVPQSRQRIFMVCIRKDIDEILPPFEFPDFGGEPIPLINALDELTDEQLSEYTISDKLWAGHQQRSQRNKDRKTGFITKVADITKPSKTIVARYGKDGKECLIPQEGRNPRKLTIEECSRLFGYPGDFRLPAAKTPAYRLLGNSVVVPVVDMISQRIIEHLGEHIL